jgi:hypothetical protein
LKFKEFRFKFIFNLNVVFTMHALKVAPICVRFSPGFPPRAGFHGEQSHKNRFFAAPASRWKYAGALLSGLQTTLEQPPWEIHPREELLLSSRSTLEQIPLREILLMEEIPG